MIQSMFSRRIALFAILTLFVTLASTYSVVIPLFEAPDETAHVDFVRFWRNEGRMPRQGEAGEAHQPPLYYALMTLASLPFDLDLHEIDRPNANWIWAGVGRDPNAVHHTFGESFPWHGAALAIHLMRGLSLLMGAATVLVTFFVGREVCAPPSAIPLGAAAIVAFNPQFLFISSVVNNDNLANLSAALATWMLVRLLVGRQDRRSLIGLGVSLGIGLLAKQNMLVFLPLAILVLSYLSWRQRSPRLLLRGGLILCISFLLIVGWWYVRNQILYGDPTGVRAFLEFRPEEGVAAIHNWSDFRVFADKMHRSFWGMFGWMNLPLPTWIYWAITAVYGLVLIGIANALKKPGDMGHRAPVGVLLVSLLVLYLLWVVIYGYQFGGSGWQGRYLFPALPAVALLFASGLAALDPVHRRSIPMLSFSIALFLVAAWAPAGVIAPAYARVTHAPAILDQVQHPLEINFADRIQLKGYDLAVVPGEQPEVSITLYWQMLNQLSADYKVFVHLVNLNWDLYGQGDGYPLAGQFPTSAWLPGDIVLDSHHVQLSQRVVAGEYRIAVGWYLEETGERLPIVQGGMEIGTVAETDPFGLHP